MSHFKIIRNSVQCMECGDVIESVRRHDYVSCECGSVAVDGGHEYLRRVFQPDAQFTDTSITEGGEDDHGNDAA